MTATSPARPRAARRGTRAYRRQLRADALEALIYLVAAAGIALMIADGGLNSTDAASWIATVARAIGIVAAVMMMTQLMLAARDPLIERSIGHDKAMALHSKLGLPAISLMLTHAVMLIVSTSISSGLGLVETSVEFASLGWWMALAQIAIAVFAIVALTSFAAVRARIAYHRWRWIHLLVYIGVALAIPHQFLEGRTFAWGEPTAWFWLLLWVASIGSFVTYRLARPVLLQLRHHPRVGEVTVLPDGAVSVTITGDGLGRLGAKPGQFFLFSFGRLGGPFAEAHPYSLSAAPGDGLRITVKPAGDGSSAVAHVKPGTPVWIEGPLGIFHDDHRDGDDVLLVAAGIGVTPIRSIVEGLQVGTRATVIIRGRDDQAALLDEVRELAEAKGFAVSEHLGRRGHTWGSADNPTRLLEHVEDPARTELYVCGPIPWADAVVAEALDLGIPAHAVHRERFGW